MVGGAARVKCLAKHLTAGRLKSELVELSQYTVLKFPRIVQYAFYLAGYNREDVCEPDTNRLLWWKAKSLLDDKFFNKLLEYNPLGPKNGKFPKYRTLNAIEKNLEEVKEDQVATYSLAYSQLLRWVQDCIKVRKQDIAVRKAKRQAARENRENKTKEKEEWEKKRAEELKNALEEAKAAWVAEKQKEREQLQAEQDELDNLEGLPDAQPLPEFKPDEAALMAEWDEKNPPIEIPPEVLEEQDNDLEISAPPA